MPSFHARNVQRWLPTALVVAVGVVFAVMYYLHPTLNDDNWFLAPFAPFMEHPSVGNFFHSWKECMLEHFAIDNGRLSNILGCVALLIPKWITATIIGTCISVSVLMSARLAGVWHRSLPLTIMVLFLTVFAMPWYDFMFGVIYAFNYIVPTAIMLSTFRYFQQGRLRNVIVAFLLGVFTCWWHELFGAGLLAAVVVFSVLDKTANRRVAVAIALGIFAALAWHLLLPGAAVRAGNTNILGNVFSLLNVKHAHIFVLTSLVYVVALCWRRWRRALFTPLALSMVATMIAGFVISRIFAGLVHATWLMDVGAIIVLVSTFRVCPVHVPSVISTLAGWLMFIVTAWHLALCLPWFFTMHREVAYARHLEEMHPGQTIFAPLTVSSEVPFFTLGKPNFHVYSIWGTGLDRVAPIALEDFDPQKAKSVGYDPSFNIWFYNGKYFVTDKETEFKEPLITYFESGGKTYSNQFFCIPFTTRTGHRYTYLRLNYVPFAYKNINPAKVYLLHVNEKKEDVPSFSEVF